MPIFPYILSSYNMQSFIIYTYFKKIVRVGSKLNCVLYNGLYKVMCMFAITRVWET